MAFLSRSTGLNPGMTNASARYGQPSSPFLGPAMPLGNDFGAYQGSPGQPAAVIPNTPQWWALHGGGAATDAKGNPLPPATQTPYGPPKNHNQVAVPGVTPRGQANITGPQWNISKSGKVAPIGPGQRLPLQIPADVSGTYQYGPSTYGKVVGKGQGAGDPGLKVQSSASYMKQLLAIYKQLGLSMAHVPPAMALSKIAAMMNPPAMNMPGSMTNAAIAAAAKGGPGTPGYIDPNKAAAAAAEQQYGGAVSADQLAIKQQGAQATQNNSDITNWYSRLQDLMQANTAADQQGYNAAAQGTAAMGPAMIAALGGNNAGGQVSNAGNIASAAADMARASGMQADRADTKNAQLQGIQDLINQKGVDANKLAALQGSLNSDLKGKGAAFTTAHDTALQTDNQNAQAHAQLLGQLNANYANQYENRVADRYKKAAGLASLNSQYTGQALATAKTKLSGLMASAAISQIPVKNAVVKAGAVTAGKTAQARLITAKSSWLKSQVAAAKVKGIDPNTNSEASAAERQKWATAIGSSIGSAPGVLSKDAAGNITGYNAQSAARIISSMLHNANISLKSYAGQSITQEIEAYLSGLVPNQVPSTKT